jgi:tetratricopeptide (TPR) repeat protein
MNRRSNAIQSFTLSNQGLGLAGRGDLVGAAGLLRKAIALEPDYGVAHYNLALVLADSGEIPGAIKELTKAISLLPANYRVWFNLGRPFLRKLKDSKGALAALSWAAHLEPADPSVRSSWRPCEPSCLPCPQIQDSEIPKTRAGRRFGYRRKPSGICHPAE